MKTEEAFSFFAGKILSGVEGVFWSERDKKGKESWIMGIGKNVPADFEKGPFPFFSLMSFLGDEKYALHFKEWYSVENTPIVGTRLIASLPGGIHLPKNLAQCSSETEQTFCQKVEQVKKYSADGEVWVLNLAHALSGKLPDERALLSVFSKFLELGKPHASGVWWMNEQKMCSMSPEVFLRQNGKIISTFPIKGTGTKSYLEKSEKEKAELSMVTDLLRNDLGQIAKKVWVKRERVLEDYGRFYQAHAEIFAELAEPILKWKDFKKLLPCGSISGAPKKRVIEKIRELESFNRKFYTGTMGVKMSSDTFIANILIRTLFVEGNRWVFPVGAGLTCDSVPRAEWKETLQKAEILRQCTG